MTRGATFGLRKGLTRGAQREALISDLPQLRSRVRSEKLAEVAAEFDGMDSIQRAVRVASVDAAIGVRSRFRGSCSPSSAGWCLRLR